MRETAVMACIVATLALLPVGGLLALVSLLAFDISLHAFVTFGDRLSAPVGLVAWWVLVLIPASVYAVIMRHEELSGG
jgi:hypothetical protein